ncbi:iron transport multicopper oxidase fet3 [Gigaspora margarita]|uniref:Iron transport multicopper oxidase fet3 n=1 Tax=Gigaspora margarita TaxID=4874 RepID=A0A8H4B0H6_GIGMA|nr:iron transport multicopper oxidase fet3 [Gigaspora margarita]
MILSKSLSLWSILCILSLLNSLVFILASPVKRRAYVPETKTFYLHLYKAKLSPDGFERVVWTVNGTYPEPTLVVTKWDRLVIYVINNLGVSTSIHYHVPNNTTFIFNFTVPDQSGTFWYHSHHLAQYVDGVLGAIIVKDPDDPYQNDYDEEVVILLSDWYHNETFTIELLFVSSNALLSFTFSIDEHAMDVIEVEGMMTKRYTIHRLIINVAQRYSVIVTANKLVSNFWMRADLQIKCYNAIGIEHLNPYVKAIVHYEGANYLDPTIKGWADNLNKKI